MANIRTVEANIPPAPVTTPAPTGFSKIFQGITYTNIGDYADAVEAFEVAVVAERAAAAQPKDDAPISISVTKGGKLSVRPTNTDRYGTFPIFEIAADTGQLLMAHWPAIKGAFDAALSAKRLTTAESAMRNWRSSKGKAEPKDLGPRGY